MDRIWRKRHDAGQRRHDHSAGLIPRTDLHSFAWLWLTLDAGEFESVEVNPGTGVVRVGLAAGTEATPTGLLRIDQPAKIGGVGNYRPAVPLRSERGGYLVSLGKDTTWLELNTSR